VRFLRRPAEWNHDDDVAEAQFLPGLNDSLALQRETVLVVIAVVARGTPQTQHGILFRDLKLIAADQMCILIALEVAQANDRGIGIKGSRDFCDAARQSVDEVLLFAGIASSQVCNAPARIEVL